MKLAWKEIQYNKAKFLLIETIIILMIFMVLFLSGLANGLSRAVSAGVDNIDANQFIVSESAEHLMTVSLIDDETISTYEHRLAENMTTLNIQRLNVTTSDSDKKLDITYFAIDPQRFIVPELIEGETFTESSDNEIILDDSFKTYGIQLNDNIIDASSKLSLKVVGFTHDQYYGHTSIGFIKTSTYTQIRLVLNPTYTPYANALVVKSGVNIPVIEGYETVNKADIISSIPGYAAEQTTINMIVWVLVVISGSILGVFFYVLTVQKEHQFGILKAMGMQMNQLSIMVISQILIIAVSGMLIGNVIAYLMSMVLPPSMPFYVTLSSSFLVSLAFTLISVFSGLISLIRIAKVDPLIAIGGNE